MRPSLLSVLLVGAVLSACAQDDAQPQGQPSTAGPASPSTGSRPEVLATGLEAPWGLDFLPGGDALLTERDTARVLRLPAAGGNPVEVTRITAAEPSGE